MSSKDSLQISMNWLERLLCWVLPYQDIWEEDENGAQALYLRRWFLRGVDDSDLKLEDRTSRVVIHKMYRSDAGRDPHDHSFGFRTCVLWGGYIDAQYEQVGDFVFDSQYTLNTWRLGPKYENMHPGKTAYRPPTHLHQVKLKNEKPCWTLVFMDKPSRVWGFVDEKGKWIDRKDYKNAGGDKK